MLIGDENSDLKFLKIILNHQQHSVFTDLYNKNIIEQIKEILPEIVIIDADIEDDKGFELCKRIRAERDFHHIPVLIACDTDDEDFLIAGFDYGATDYISKPFDEEEVKIRIDNRLDVIKTHLKAQAKNETFTKDDASLKRNNK